MVVIASDEIARKNGKKPIFSQETRRRVVEALKPVDEAIIGGTGNIFDTISSVRPDVITLGFDQKFDPDVIVNVNEECESYFISPEYIAFFPYGRNLEYNSSRNGMLKIFA